MTSEEDGTCVYALVFGRRALTPRKNLTNNTSRCSIADNYVYQTDTSARHSVKSSAFFVSRMMYERWVNYFDCRHDESKKLSSAKKSPC